MNWPVFFAGGFASTIVLTTILAGTQALRLTRMNVPYLLGTMLTASRDRAKLLGVLMHLVNGWLFALIYAAIFHAWGGATPLRGAAIALGHSAFVLLVGLPTLPALHPRMASETYGPTTTRQLEPPGFLALHYGVRTPVSVVIAHIAFGLLLGYALSLH